MKNQSILFCFLLMTVCRGFGATADKEEPSLLYKVGPIQRGPMVYTSTQEAKLPDGTSRSFFTSTITHTVKGETIIEESCREFLPDGSAKDVPYLPFNAVATSQSCQELATYEVTKKMPNGDTLSLSFIMPIRYDF